MKIEHCRSCGSKIIWLKTKSGKSMPVNAETVQENDQLYDHTRHVSHFSNCKQANDWRSKQPPKSEFQEAYKSIHGTLPPWAKKD